MGQRVRRGALIGATGLLAMAAPAAANGPNTGEAFVPAPVSQPLYAAPSEPSHRHTVPAADGEPIHVATWLPEPEDGREPPEKLPAILVSTPYATATDHAAESLYIAHLVERGYAVSVADTRGTNRSGGCRDFWGPQEADATARVIEYVGSEAPWASGRVGMYGISDPGTSQLAAATLAEPERLASLKTIVPLAALSSYYGSVAYDGVPLYAMEQGFPVIATALFEPPGDAPPNPNRGECLARNVTRNVELDGDYDDFHAAREFRARVHRIDVPVLHVQGLADTSVWTTHGTGFADRLPAHSKVVIGQWEHTYPDLPNPYFGDLGDWRRDDWRDMLVAWFDRWVKGLDTRVEDWPAVQVQDRQGQWRVEDRWPTTTGPTGQLALGPAGSLGATEPDGTTTYREESTTWAAGGAAFETPALEAPLRLTGQPVLDLWVQLEQPDAHIAVKLEIVDADGRGQTSFEWPQLRGMRSARHLEDFVEGRFEQREQVAPPVGEPVLVPIRLTPMDVIVPAGHRLRLTVAGQTDLYVGPLPQGGQPSGVSQQVKILHDCEHTSVLRFAMPDPDAPLLDVREPGEEGPLGTNAGAPLVGDGGGIATAQVCG